MGMGTWIQRGSSKALVPPQGPVQAKPCSDSLIPHRAHGLGWAENKLENDKIIAKPHGRE